MHAQDDDGLDLNADFTVEADGPYLSLILESAGGRGRSGDSRPRNDQYVPALRLLLRRLADRRAVLLAALLASTPTRTLPEDERTLLQGPVHLADVTDIEQLRLDITRPQGHVALAPGSDSNNRRRLQLRLEVPGYRPGEAHQLAGDLAAAPLEPPLGSLDARELLRSLIGEQLSTVTGQPNVVLAVNGDNALVRTTRSPGGQPVAVSEVQAGLSKLIMNGSVLVSVEELGHRSAFIGAVLATLPGTTTTQSPATVMLNTLASAQAAGDATFAELDSVANVKVRKEQAQLRQVLAGNREQASCALCGHDYPLRFLIAAHIKKRSLCSDTERRDLRNVAMLACSFGCDALYEAGWITVDEHGNVLTVDLEEMPDGRLRDHLRQLGGRRSTAHSSDAESYFAWHRTTVFRGASALKATAKQAL